MKLLILLIILNRTIYFTLFNLQIIYETFNFVDYTEQDNLFHVI